MKSTVLSIAVAAALSLAAIGVQAAPESAGETVQIKAPAGFRFEPQQFDDFNYAYDLDNGASVRFSRRVARYYAQLEGSPKVEIFPVAPNEFVTRAGARVTFADEGWTLSINNYERLPMVAKLPANTIVMAKR